MAYGNSWKWTTTALALAAGMCSSNAVAQDLWQAITPVQWSGEAATDNRYALEDGIVYAFLPRIIVEDHWLRVSASANVDAPDFKVWIHQFDRNQNPLGRPLPTLCKVIGNRKICSNYAWVPPVGAPVRISFYSGGVPVLLTPGQVEIAQGSSLDPSDERRFGSIIQQLQILYYRSSEVDWAVVAALGRKALLAPSDIDPVPVAIALVISRLPGNQHSSVIGTLGASTDEPVQLPNCNPLGQGKGRLVMPSTPDSDKDRATYLRAAHDCLARQDTKLWVVDLTGNGGGDASLMFAALSPLFGPGPQMMYTNPDGDQFVVSIGDRSVSVDDEVSTEWSYLIGTSDAEAVFVVDGGCGSACEAVAIATRGRFRTYGSATAGLTTANELLPINDYMAAAVTAGYMADLHGTTYLEFVPDVTLSEAEIKNLLENGELDNGG